MCRVCERANASAHPVVREYKFAESVSRKRARFELRKIATYRRGEKPSTRWNIKYITEKKEREEREIKIDDVYARTSGILAATRVNACTPCTMTTVIKTSIGELFEPGQVITRVPSRAKQTGGKKESEREKMAILVENWNLREKGEVECRLRDYFVDASGKLSKTHPSFYPCPVPFYRACALNGVVRATTATNDE